MSEPDAMFADRVDAGRRLAERLAALKLDRPVVLALPRGGVPIGFEVARALQAPLDVLLVRKIGAPGHEEFALGAIVEGEPPIIVLNQGMPARLNAYIEGEVRQQAAEMDRRRALYRGGRPLTSIAGRTVIVADDGIATGATFRAALKAVKQLHAAKVVAAIPVAPPESLSAVEALADEVVCLAAPEAFEAVGFHYANFDQTSDEEVIHLLKQAAPFGQQRSTS